MSSDSKLSPMMLQWHTCKKAAKNAILFFRLGDFYEAFYEDANLISKELDLTLTKRQEIPMSGVPAHSAEGYIDKLVAKGYKIAIAEQTEDPKKTKGIVKREITRVVTPGSVVNSSLLNDKVNNFITSIAQVGQLYGLSHLDLTTGEFKVIEFSSLQELQNELYRLSPSECIMPVRFREKNPEIVEELKRSRNCMITALDDWRFDHQITCDFLTSHFQVHSLDGFGLKGMLAAINAAGSLLAYLKEGLFQSIEHIQELRLYSTAEHVVLDRTTQRNLELVESLKDSSQQHTLLSVLDHTCTPMGGRLLKQWILQPLFSCQQIKKRQDGVETLFKDSSSLGALNSLLSGIKDLERLMMRISAGYAGPRDLSALKLSFEPISQLKPLLKGLSSEIIRENAFLIDDLPEMTTLISSALVEDPPLRVSDGHVFKEGYNKELDELKVISRDSKSWMANYQTELRELSGIKTLKVGYTRISGFYIEVTRGQAEKVPDFFQRRQTLTNAERYSTNELKEYEEKVLTAEDKIAELENELFLKLRHAIAQYAVRVLQIARAIAHIDCLQSLSSAARRYDYVRPEVNEGLDLEIIEGRHPVIEGSCLSERFVPNDTHLDHQNNRLFVITGPNMAGKSTYIRQVALITIMAHIGSYVPAKQAKMGLVDKVFTRIGASDDLSRGLSTFMVEMTETANILNNATNRSLVILDEIGRGTSTYDGIAIAWSVAEYLLTAEGRQAKTLFATHYWELTKLEGKVQGAVNYNVAVHESDGHIVFLRKIVKGDTDKSYGIHVARLAGLPALCLMRAKEILIHLEENSNQKSAFEPAKLKRVTQQKIKQNNSEFQLSFIN